MHLPLAEDILWQTGGHSALYYCSKLTSKAHPLDIRVCSYTHAKCNFHTWNGIPKVLDNFRKLASDVATARSWILFRVRETSQKSFCGVWRTRRTFSVAWRVFSTGCYVADLISRINKLLPAMRGSHMRFMKLVQSQQWRASCQKQAQNTYGWCGAVVEQRVRPFACAL